MLLPMGGKLVKPAVTASRPSARTVLARRAAQEQPLPSVALSQQTPQRSAPHRDIEPEIEEMTPNLFKLISTNELVKTSSTKVK